MTQINQQVNPGDGFEEQDLQIEPPIHTIKTSEGAPCDEFEFVCTEEWHSIFIEYSFDRGVTRGHHDTRRATIQAGAIMCLIGGLINQIHKNQIVRSIGGLTMHRPVSVGDRIKIRLSNGVHPKGALKILKVEIFVLLDSEWKPFTMTTVSLVSVLIPK